MSPRATREPAESARPPRASGDEPESNLSVVELAGSAPRERG